MAEPIRVRGGCAGCDAHASSARKCEPFVAGCRTTSSRPGAKRFHLGGATRTRRPDVPQGTSSRRRTQVLRRARPGDQERDSRPDGNCSDLREARHDAPGTDSRSAPTERRLRPPFPPGEARLARPPRHFDTPRLGRGVGVAPSKLWMRPRPHGARRQRRRRTVTEPGFIPGSSVVRVTAGGLISMHFDSMSPRPRGTGSRLRYTHENGAESWFGK